MTDDEFQARENARHDRKTFVTAGGVVVIYLAGLMLLVLYLITVFFI